MILVSFEMLTHIGKFSGDDSGDFPENFSKKNILLYCDVTTDDYWKGSRGINKWRVGAPRHDITANLISYLILKFEFKADSIEKSGEWLRGFSGKFFQNRF